MNIFELKNYQVVCQPQTFLIEEFKAIKDRNKRNIEKTTKEISFVWFFADIKSDFSIILDENERGKEIRDAIGLPKTWKKDGIIDNAIEFYKKYSKTPSSGLYESSVTACQYIEKQLKNPKDLLEEKDAKGNVLYKLDTILRMMKDVPDVMEKLHKAKLQVIKEIEDQGQVKGSKTKSTFEDGI